MTEPFIRRLLETEDFGHFRDFVKSLDNVNKYLIEEQNNSLNLLHICIGFKETDFMLKCLRYLLSEPDISVNCLAKIDGNCVTGAHIAIDWSHHKILQILIDFGIDLFVCDYYGLSAMDYAIKTNDQKSQTLIQKAIEVDLCSKINSLDLFNNYKHFNSDKTLNIDLNSNQLKDNIEPKNQSIEEINSEKTIEYFDENQSIWKTFENKSHNSSEDSSSDGSENTLISNISYGKTESLKSFCSDTTEVYVYNDKDNDIQLIEERFEGCPQKFSSGQQSSETVAKGNSTQTESDLNLTQIECMNGTQIYNELRAMGDSPGPIVSSTKRCYAKRLFDLRRGQTSPIKIIQSLPGYSHELNLLLKGEFPFEEAERLEQQFIDFFKDYNCKRNHFNYLLIDPNITENIPLKANQFHIVINCKQINEKLFKRFIKSVFYVGKGRGDRVYQHFYEAIKTDDKQIECPKVKRIHQIWSTNKGVVSLHCFNGISSEEAFARESVIIECLVLSNLTNQVNGQYIRGLKWNERKRRLFGSYLLYKSFGLYILTGERQIRRPVDH